MIYYYLCACLLFQILIYSLLLKLFVAVLRLLHLRRGSGTQLTLAASNRITRKGNNATRLATVSLSNPSQPVTSSNNLLAYRPRFADFHGSNLAAVFINMEGVYPCLQTLTGNYLPLCQVLSEEDDGFRRGKALIGAGDSGNHFRVFSTSSVLTYGVAIQDCPEFSTTCLPVLSSFTVACILPRTPCS